MSSSPEVAARPAIDSQVDGDRAVLRRRGTADEEPTTTPHRRPNKHLRLATWWSPRILRTSSPSRRRLARRLEGPNRVVADSRHEKRKGTFNFLSAITCLRRAFRTC